MKRLLLMLWPVVVLLGCSGSKVQLDESAGADPLEEQIALINEHVTDPGRRDQCLAVAAEWKEQLTVFHDQYRDHVRSLNTLYADYHSSESQFQQAYDRFNPKFEGMLTQLIEARQALRDLVTEEEWKQLSARKKSYVPNPTQ